MKSIRLLSDVGRDDLAVAGGKGANLGELVRAGFDVPDGFVITTAAYRRSVEHLQVSRAMADAAGLRTAVAAVALPEDIRTDILAAYRRLGSGAVAVRSSATAEDLPGAAFAGQQETFLNVRGDDGLIAAVTDCWASLWSDRAIAYRNQRGIAHTEVEIAVVVQTLIPADLAGVMFTADPVTGEREHLVIDASPGLGEAVVSGLVTPEHVVVDRQERVVEHRAGRAEVVLRPDDAGGVRVDAAHGAASELSPERLRALAAAGRAIAAHFGSPQDIEWAFVGERLRILQSRSLTALPPKPRRVNPVRRLMGSIVAELMPVRPYPLDMSTWTIRGHGRILLRMLGELPGIALDLHAMLPEVDGVVDELVPPAPRLTVRTLSAPARLLRRARRFDPREWTQDPRFARFEREIAQLRAIDPRELTWRELVGVPDRVLASLDELITLRIDYLPRAGLSLAKLRVRLALLGLGREAGPLSRGVRTRTSDANAGLAELARVVAARADWRTVFVDSDAATITHRLETDVALAPLRARLAAHVAEFGHREVRSAFLMSDPTWGEQPSLLYDGIVAALDDPAAVQDAGAISARIAEERLTARRRVRLTGAGPGILAAAAEARAGIAFREDTHFHAPRGLPALRAALLEAGRRLAEAGVLDSADDVLHVRLEELVAIDNPADAPAALGAVARDRSERRAHRAGAPLISPATLYPHRARVRNAVVSGTPAGGGRATGAVRVVRSPEEFGALLPGEVLVCPYTNPSWTPLFQRAAAVVVDTGGLASHAAIVAREYGIPAIMGTGVGTRVLHDGEIVSVDGDSGAVRSGEGR